MDELFKVVIMAVVGLISYLADRAAKKKKAEELARQAERRARPQGAPARPTASTEGEPPVVRKLQEFLEERGLPVEMERRAPPPVRPLPQRPVMAARPPKRPHVPAPSFHPPSPSSEPLFASIATVAASTERARKPVHPLVRGLHRKGGLRQAIVMIEVLGRPVSERDPLERGAA